MLFRAICLQFVISTAVSAIIRGAAPLQRRLEPHSFASASALSNKNVEAGNLQRRVSQDEREKKWSAQLEEAPWINSDSCNGYGQNNLYFTKSLSKKVNKRIPLSKTESTKSIFTFPSNVRYTVRSTGTTYQGDELVLKFVNIRVPHAACEVVALRTLGYFVEAGVTEVGKTGVIVMLKQPGQPLHKVDAWRNAPLQQKFKIYHEAQDQACSQVYQWIRLHDFVYSDFTPLNLPISTRGKGKDITLQSVKFVDFGPPGVVEIRNHPSPEEFEKWFSARWDFLWEPLVVIPANERPPSACPGLLGK
ncbi:hypothetical protein F5050DRAFT_373745 [Lentinula boryana]|uniref:Uncharacterized protein n=1 Tax=Lentinula boryana TaxID=40481 RepID=A0ABQ8Q9E9_9AGAR|nr:hypothetical protein F5050DRAFT_373745 [Lentinula boryana]